MRPTRAAVLGWTLALATMAGAASEPDADWAIESLTTADVHLVDTVARLRHAHAEGAGMLSLTGARVRVNYRPAAIDLVSRARARTEDRAAAQLTFRWGTRSTLSGIAGGGGYRGFTDYRSVWLAEFYQQLFAGVPGYVPASPRGWTALAGARWAYRPASGFLQATVLAQNDKVSPGYEPQIGGPLRRGREHLQTAALRLSTENILGPAVRTLLEAGVIDTTGRPARGALQGSLNWAAAESWTLRTVLAGVTERPAFRAGSATVTVERDWDARWFAGLALRAYRDTGEVVDPLIPSSAAPALRTWHAMASLRWQGERAAVRLEAGPYRTRYAALPAPSGQFARLYSDRHWRRVQATGEWRF